jgi:hypothetical protein
MSWVHGVTYVPVHSPLSRLVFLISMRQARMNSQGRVAAETGR